MATKDWLLNPISTKPWTKNLRQATLNIQRMVPPLDPVLTDGWKVRNPSGSSLEESPKTITASRMSMEEGGMNVPTGSMSNTVIKEQQQSSKLILLFPEDGKQKDPDKSMEMMASYPVDGKLGSKVKDGKKLKSFQQDGKFKFNKKGRLKEREQIEISK